MEQKNKLKLFLSGVILIIILFSIIFLLNSNKNNLQVQNNDQKTMQNTTQNNNLLNNKIILFYGETCPHCKKVDDYLKNNPPQFEIDHREVYFDESNQKILLEVAQICNINPNQIGVPLLWLPQDKKCISGDEPIINYLKNKNQ
jgi:glutaredoxin